MKLRIPYPLWHISPYPVDYNISVSKMEDYVEQIKQGNLKNSIIMLVENFDVYTKGISSKKTDLLYNNDIPILETKRGGKFTYHGIGQRIIYPVINLSYVKDINLYIQYLQDWIIDTLSFFGIKAYKRDGLIGVWVRKDNSKFFKIAAIGIRVTKWIAYHGIAVNVQTNISNYDAIVPCGIRDDGVISIKDLGVNINMEDFDIILQKKFNNYFDFVG